MEGQGGQDYILQVACEWIMRRWIFLVIRRFLQDYSCVFQFLVIGNVGRSLFYQGYMGLVFRFSFQGRTVSQFSLRFWSQRCFLFKLVFSRVFQFCLNISRFRFQMVGVVRQWGACGFLVFFRAGFRLITIFLILDFVT